MKQLITSEHNRPSEKFDRANNGRSNYHPYSKNDDDFKSECLWYAMYLNLLKEGIISIFAKILRSALSITDADNITS